jgi:hypothetical protein
MRKPTDRELDDARAKIEYEDWCREEYKRQYQYYLEKVGMLAHEELTPEPRCPFSDTVH